jgi:hypothetical protein
VEYSVNLFEQHPGHQQGYAYVEQLRNQEGIKWFFTLSVEQFPEIRFQSDAGECQCKPNSLKGFQVTLYGIVGIGINEEGKEQ